MNLEMKNFLKSEEGNIESAMVLIPLIFLFLCGMQLTSTVFIRNLEIAKVQSEASTKAISHQLQSEDLILPIETQNRWESQNLLVVNRDREVPIILPGLSKILGGRLLSSVKGVAVIEPSS
jgi:hypothetical protein